MLRTLALRVPLVSRSLRALSTAPPAVTREPGVVGLPIADASSRQQLADIYAATLEAVSSLPPSAAYRTNVEKLTKHRMGVVERCAHIDEIEEALGVGPIEEVIEMAQDELDLVPHMAQWQPWAVPEGKEKVSIELID